MGQIEGAIRDLVRDEVRPLADKVDALLIEIRSRMVDRKPAKLSSVSAEANGCYTRKQAAATLHRHPRTIARWIKQGRLRPTAPGGRWISQFEIERFLAAGDDEGGEDPGAVVARIFKTK